MCAAQVPQTRQQPLSSFLSSRSECINRRIFVAIASSATAQLALVEAIHFASLPGASLCIGTVLDTSMLDQNNISMGSTMAGPDATHKPITDLS